MARTSVALKQVLDTYGISQNKLAVTVGISRANVGRWYQGIDSSAKNIALIADGLKVLDVKAFQGFLRLYFGVLVLSYPVVCDFKVLHYISLTVQSIVKCIVFFGNTEICSSQNSQPRIFMFE